MRCDTYYLNLLYGRGNLFVNLNRYLATNDGSGYQKALRLCYCREEYNQLLGFNSMFSKHFGAGLRVHLALDNLSNEKIVILSTELLVQNKSMINTFLNYKNIFERQVLTKDYNSAEATLLEVYEELGISLWLLDSISVLSTLSTRSITEKFGFSDYEGSYYNLFDLKNNVKERHSYYTKRISESLTKTVSKEEQRDFFKHLLFVENPSSQKSWINVIKSTYDFSLIDIYLATEQFLLYSNLTGNAILHKCYSRLLDIRNVEGSTYTDSELQAQTEAKDIINLFNGNKFDKVTAVFFSNHSNQYNHFGAYKLAALSYLFSDEEPSESDVLSAQIIYLIYHILKKQESSTIPAMNGLVSIARLLRSFQIHKGMCMFAEEFVEYNLKTKFGEQLISLADYEYINNEANAENMLLFPCRVKTRYVIEETEVSDFLENYGSLLCKFSDASDYFREVYTKCIIDIHIAQSNCAQVAEQLVLAYVDNKMLVYCLDSSWLVQAITEKILNKQVLSLGELCYVFIDDNSLFLSERRNCFLNFFDDIAAEEPMELVSDKGETDAIVLFFLENVCSKEMLPKLYRRFRSTEDVELYRLRICEFLLGQEKYRNKKELLAEAEKISKTRALSKKLKAVEKSRITINTDFIKSNCYDALSEEIDAYNVTKEEAVCVGSSAFEGVPIVVISNGHNTVLQKMYSIYAKEFCFGNQSIDMSLSTRVRHGAFSNQILKAFKDNHLQFNGHGRNEFFDNCFAKKTIDPEVCKVFLEFSGRLEEILNYFTQHTLKVVFDKPIKDAVFRYDLDETVLWRLYQRFGETNFITFEEVAFFLNNCLLEKTKEHLAVIKNEKLPLLLQNVIDEIDILAIEVRRFILNDEEDKIIERLLTKCKTDVQNAFALVADWFSLSEYNDWEDYSFKELTETCYEIVKSMFDGFDNLEITTDNTESLVFRGNTFRNMVDVLLIIFNNAIIHAGYKDQLQDLRLNVGLTTDSKSIYLAFSNNLSDTVNLIELDEKVEKINSNFANKSYLRMNTRQEGGMGLYKIMHMLFSVLDLGDAFYVSRQEHTFRLEIKIKKEMLVDEKNLNC